jgi:SAM-dependent methyltransferase
MSRSMDAADVISTATVGRALETHGTSNSRALFALVRSLVVARGRRGVVLDMGCGTGSLHSVLSGCFDRYLGVDVVRHAGFPSATDATFVALDLDRPDASMADETVDVVCCLETIEHLENPRALARQLDRLARPGALIVISTPNQLSLLSKVCLLAKNEFAHFQDGPGLYPAHLSALLECDLVRIARENGWRDIAVHYTGDGRMPGLARKWPSWLASQRGWRGRAFSDNVVLAATKPGAGGRRVET